MYHVKVSDIWLDDCPVQNPSKANWLGHFLVDFHRSRMKSRNAVSLREWPWLMSGIRKVDRFYGDLGCMAQW